MKYAPKFLNILIHFILFSANLAIIYHQTIENVLVMKKIFFILLTNNLFIRILSFFRMLKI